MIVCVYVCVYVCAEPHLPVPAEQGAGAGVVV